MSEQNTQEANKALIRRWFEEVWNKGRAEAIHEMMAEDCVNHGLTDDGEPMRGAAGFVPFHTQFREAFPNIYVVVEDAIAEADKVVARLSVKGKHEGNGLGFEATGKSVDFDAIIIARVKHGLFVESWNRVDFARMNRQLGAA